jgi:hypothetical protein
VVEYYLLNSEEKLGEMESFKESFGLVSRKKRAASSSVGRQDSKRDQQEVTSRRTNVSSKAPAAEKRILKRTANRRITVLKYKAPHKYSHKPKVEGTLSLTTIRSQSRLLPEASSSNLKFFCKVSRLATS